MGSEFLIRPVRLQMPPETPAFCFLFSTITLQSGGISKGRNVHFRSELCGVMFVYILYIYLKVFKWLKHLGGSGI